MGRLPPSRADHTSTWGHGAWCRWGPGTASLPAELRTKTTWMVSSCEVRRDGALQRMNYGEPGGGWGCRQPAPGLGVGPGEYRAARERWTEPLSLPYLGPRWEAVWAFAEGRRHNAHPGRRRGYGSCSHWHCQGRPQTLPWGWRRIEVLTLIPNFRSVPTECGLCWIYMGQCGVSLCPAPPIRMSQKALSLLPQQTPAVGQEDDEGEEHVLEVRGGRNHWAQGWTVGGPQPQVIRIP